MSNSSTSSIVGWLLSIILYLTLLATMAHFLAQHNAKLLKYTANKKNLLTVTLIEPKTTHKVQEKQQKVVKKIETVNIEKPKEVQETKRAEKVSKEVKKPDFKDLFSKIDLTKVSEDTQQRKTKVRKKVEQKSIDEVLKAQKAKEITKTLEFQKQETLTSASNEGVYDAFKGRVSDILHSRWQETVDTVSGTVASVTIMIDNLGRFSYKIESLSYNDDFNAKLRNFLEEMRDENFPPYTDGGVFVMKTEFKDELE